MKGTLRAFASILIGLQLSTGCRSASPRALAPPGPPDATGGRLVGLEADLPPLADPAGPREKPSAPLADPAGPREKPSESVPPPVAVRMSLSENDAPLPRPTPLPDAVEESSLAPSSYRKVTAEATAAEETGALFVALAERVWRQWREASERGASAGGIESSSGADERNAVAARLLALFLARPDSPPPPPALDAARLLGASECAGVEEHLLAAAAFERAGDVEERDAALRRVLAETSPPAEEHPRASASAMETATGAGAGDALPAAAPPGSASASAASPGFRIEELAFAREIGAGGSYTARETSLFEPGEVARIYGELAGFRASVTPGPAEARYRSSFSARLRLLDAAENVRHEGTFLRAGSAVREDPRPRQKVEFWADYSFPPDLEPGPYALEVIAEDLEGQREATARLDLSITAGPGKLETAQ